MKYKAGYKYILAETLVRKTRVCPDTDRGIENMIILKKDGTLILQRGYAWDGVTCAPDTKENMEAGLVHDALYQMLQEGLLPLSYQKQCDEELRDIMIEKGSFKITAHLFYKAVATFGKYFIKYPGKVIEI